MDNFIGYFRKVTTNRLKVNNQLEIGNKAIFAGTGTTYYVDSDASNAADTNSGRSWARPLATIDGAINKCTANQGDTIILAESHSETYTTTGAKFVADVAGITIIGLGEGSDRPTISYGHTGTTATISAANVTIQNILFLTAVDSVVTYATISGADCKLINCEGRDVTDKEVISDFTITGDRFVSYNYFKNGYTSGNANARVFSMNGVDNALIQHCRFMTKVTTAIVNFVTTACTNVVVDDCVFYVNGTTDYSKNVVDTITGSSWIVTKGYDIGAGAKFSGGSGGALAGDDVGAVSTALATVDTVVDGIAADLGDYSGRTNLQSKLAVDGNPDTAGATTWSVVINSNPNYNSALGTKVTRAAADILDGTTTSLFTISGGRILLTHISLEVTTAAVDNTASNTKLVSNPTVGTDMDLCANLDVDSDEAGSLYSITGTITDALQGGSGGGAPALAKPIELPEGTIDLVSAADAGTGGALVKCEMWYIVLDSGASVAST